MPERRANTRQKTFLKAVLSFQNGTASEDGVVRNLSESGALLQLPDPRAPETFDLLIPAHGRRAAARVVWRVGARIGVRLEPAGVSARSARPKLRDEGY